MPRRRALTEVQLEALLALPTDEADLVRHYTLSAADLAVIAQRRRAHNRLGFAVRPPFPIQDAFSIRARSCPRRS